MELSAGYPMVGHVRLDRRQRALTDECSWTQPLMEGTCFNVETSDLVVAFALSEPKNSMKACARG